MVPLDIPEIKEAQELFDRFEKKQQSLDGVAYYVQAREILDLYVEENPSSPFIKVISEKKKTYLKLLIKNLQFINTSNFYNWINLYIILLSSGIETVETITSNDKDLQKIYDNYVNEWKDTQELNNFIKIFIKEQA